jgi:cytochrome c oxidase cbb3-type subunit 3
MSSFWSGWIILLTGFTIVATVWLLFSSRYSAGDGGTTGHEYDGIEEFDNPLPAWWLWMFVLTIVYSIGYLVVYPGMGTFAGTFGWTQVNQYDAEVAKANSKYGPVYQKYAAMSIEDVAKDEQAMRMAGRLFRDNCAQCHGSDAKGSMGFPNLADNNWIWGGEAEQIKTSITSGRQAAMPAWGPILKEQGVHEVAEYLLSLGGRQADAQMAAAGEQHYNTYCVACHGADGTGNPMMGAPNLSDETWLYGGSRKRIRETLNNGRNGQMPAQEDVLYAEKIHLLSAYVYSLSN